MGKLFKTGGAQDSAVASLFSSSAGPVSKPPKRVSEDAVEPPVVAATEEDDEELSEVSDVEFDDDEDVEDILAKVGSKRKRGHEEVEIEDKYFAKLSKEAEKEQQAKGQDQEYEDKDEEDGDDDEDKDEDKDEKSTKGPDCVDRTKLLDTTELAKAEATVFIGNVPSAVISDKKQYKAFKRQFAEVGSIGSIRFRSIAFSEMLPRKAAFVKQKLHSKRDAVNAYVVFEDKASVAPALKLNGSVFSGHHIRVDSVAHPAKHDHKRAVFVGNLDFDTTEEQLWTHFGDCGGPIESVRLIRDAKTNIGKGIGYVQFADSMSVPKALLLNDKELKSTQEGRKGRKLRVSRSKPMKAERPSSASGQAKRLKPSASGGLTTKERTQFGRAKSVLGKAGRVKVDQIVEGTRAKAGDLVPGLKVGGGKGKRKNKPRIRARSTNFKKRAT